MKGCDNPSPPFTTFHSSGNRTSVHLLLLSPSTGFRFFVAHHFSAKLFGYTICLPRKNSQVKGGEGLEQPFTLIFPCDSTTYTVKVKSEGLSQIFFGVHRLISKNQQRHAEEIQCPFISSSTNSHSKVRKMRRQGIFPYALSLVPLRYR